MGRPPQARARGWWGPPTYPATVVEQDLRAGGKVAYLMTSPEGEQHHGWWKVLEVDEPHRLGVDDGFADAEGNPADAMPTTHFTVTLTELASGATRMVIEARFPSTEAMEQLLAMGMEEGMTQAVGQIDAILAEDAVASV